MMDNMLETNHFPNEHWVEAVTTAIYIMNQCQTKSVKNKVPQESWIGMNHSVSHLNFFHCVAYARVIDELRKKLDNKVQKCIFVDYSKDTKSYQLYDLVIRKLIISRNVHFVENESWDGTIDKNVKIVSNVEHDDLKEEVVQTPHVSQTVATP